MQIENNENGSEKFSFLERMKFEVLGGMSIVYYEHSKG
jgi:hypothetical protein